MYKYEMVVADLVAVYGCNYELGQPQRVLANENLTPVVNYDIQVTNRILTAGVDH